jgi:hypothetical protein
MGGRPLSNFARQSNGIICIEMPWHSGNNETDETRPKSVLPGLELISRYYGYLNLLYRTCATQTELKFHFDDFRGIRKNSRDRYGLLYFATHGSKAALGLPGEPAPLSLSDLAELMGKTFSGFSVYFGSCSVMKCSDAELNDFQTATGSDMIVGYEADVDWIDSTILDILFLNKFAAEERPKSKKRFLGNFGSSYGAMIEKYEMMFYNV